MGRRDSELLMQALGMAIGLGKDYIGYRQGQQSRDDRNAQQDRQFGLQDRQFGLQQAQFDNLIAQQKSRGAEVADQLNVSVSNAGRSFITPGAETQSGGVTGSYGASTTGGGMNDVTPPPAPPDISPAAAPSMTENGPPSAVATPPTGAQTMAKLQAATRAPKPDISVDPDAYAGQAGLPPRLPTITSGPPPSAKPAFTLSDGRLVSQIDPEMTPQGRAEVFAEKKNVAANALKNRQAADRLGIRGTAFDPNHDYVGDAHLSDEKAIAGVRADNAPHFQFLQGTDANGKPVFAKANTRTGEIVPTDMSGKLGGTGGQGGQGGQLKLRAADIIPQIDAAMQRMKDYEDGLQSGKTTLSAGDQGLVNTSNLDPKSFPGTFLAPKAAEWLGKGGLGGMVKGNTAAANYMKDRALVGQLLKQAIPGNRSERTATIDAASGGVDAGWTPPSILQVQAVRAKAREGLENIIDGGVGGGTPAPQVGGASAIPVVKPADDKSAWIAAGRPAIWPPQP